MQLMQVVGTVVSTQKDEKLNGVKFLIGKEIRMDGTMTETYHVAVDTVGAGPGEVVIIVRGSSARLTDATDKKPVDTAIIGIVDEIEVAGNIVWKKH